MKSSGHNQPCPVCSRVKDADCRFNDEVVLCHTGTDLRPGDTITISGAQWAFIHHNGGFSGSAAVFKPHREKELTRGQRLHTPSSAQELLSRQTKRSQWAHILDQFHDAYDEAWNIPDLYTCIPNQFQSACAAITDAQAKAAALRPHLRTIWRDHEDLSQLHRLRVEAQLKSIAYIAEDLRQFQQNELGLPCPAAVQALAEGI